MRWHYPLGHLSIPKLKQLALNGEIPKKLSKVKSPTCAGCLFGAMTKNPWRGKESKSSHKFFVTTKPGETVSCDQMASTEAGFFAQLKRTLTKKRHKWATIFIDHVPDYDSSIFKSTTLPSKLSQPSKPLRPSPPSTASASSTTTATMGVSTTTPSRKLATMAANVSPSVVSTPTSKMESLSVRSGTSARALGSSYSTHVRGGRQQCILPYGHMPFATLPSCTTACRCSRMARQG